MPHSSGGGSHSGGHHSSSHHSSYHSYHSSGSSSYHSSSTPTSKKSTTYFEGSKKYVYYVNKQPEYVYANYDIKPNNGCEKRLAIGCLSTIWAWFVLITVLLVTLTGRHAPKKLLTTYNTEIVIQDDANVIPDRLAVEDAFKRFFDETGITPAVKTLTQEEWEETCTKYENLGTYNLLEKYAFDWYVDHFEDEKHWLIVYRPDNDLSDGFDDWRWEGMQGDDTDPILSSRETDLFNKTFQKCLLQRNQYSVGEALITAFDTLTPVAMKRYIPGFSIVIAIIAGGFFSLMFLPPIFLLLADSKRNKKYKTAVECPEGFTDQETCPFCQGVYVKGLHTTCPHCGAEVQKTETSLS